jgi:hypothetical protein
VPDNAAGALKVVVTFDGGPLTGPLEARTRLDVKSK